MSGSRKSTRLRKPITMIDQNLDDDPEDDEMMPSKSRKTSQRRTSIKRPSTDDNDELEIIAPKKRAKKKASNNAATTTKTSPYFDKKSAGKKSTSPVPAPKKPQKKTSKENTTTVKAESDQGSGSDLDSDSDDDEDGWHEVAVKTNEEVAIQKLLKEREEKPNAEEQGEVEVTLTSEEVARAQGKRKKNIHSREHQLELQLKRVLKKNFLRKHKHHIVCNLAHGFHLVKTYINHTELRSLMFSLLDESQTKSLMYHPKTTNMNDLHRLVKYFNEVFVTIDKPTSSKTTSDEKEDHSPITLEKLRQAMSEHLVKSTSPIRVILFAIYVRLLNYECRLVFAADLPPIRPKAQKEEKFHIPHGSVKRRSKKVSDSDDTSQSTTEDASRLHAHDHSSDISRVVAPKSTKLVKDHQAISPPPTTTTTVKPKVQRRPLLPRYYWIELFVETSEDGYIPIDVYTSTVNGATEFESNVKFPMLYVWAFDADTSSTYAKDVTKRYSQKWLTNEYRTSHIEHKTNGDPKWYENLMKKYAPKDRKKFRHSAMETKQIESRIAQQPIPQSKSELIGHPLYVLKSKLLKFEGIYPNDTQPIGWLKEEPIYSREYIHILRSKQTWLKEARQVNEGEEAYKVVEGRIKNSDRKLGVTTRPQLELFGEWQTSKYVPPVAKDGIVPCNEYGNVDLFQPEMLPIGCVHIVEPNAARLCKKLGINYAEAITGFDAHGGGSHPVIEGIVICQEFEETLREAIEQQKQIAREKELKKKEERVYKNWRKLIRGLIIKQNLARKYGDKEEKDQSDLATDAKYQWPLLPKDDQSEDSM